MIKEKWTIFGERLKTESTKQGISYRQFAEKVGLTLTTVHRYANSQRVPRATEIVKVSNALGVTCDYMIGLSDDPHKTNNQLSAQSEIVRCKDCKYWREHKYAKETKRYIPFCGFNAIYTKSDDFCSRAERREE